MKFQGNNEYSKQIIIKINFSSNLIESKAFRIAKNQIPS